MDGTAWAAIGAMVATVATFANQLYTGRQQRMKDVRERQWKLDDEARAVLRAQGLHNAVESSRQSIGSAIAQSVIVSKDLKEAIVENTAKTEQNTAETQAAKEAAQASAEETAAVSKSLDALGLRMKGKQRPPDA